MPVSLASITFNHNPRSARASALNIRKDGDSFATLPEWRAGAAGFPAAYSIADTAGGARIVVLADLSGPANATLEIRAIPASPFVANVLGPLEPQSVDFPAVGRRPAVAFTLRRPLLLQTGVGAHDVSWRWQSRDAADASWTDFETTTHRIYTVLRVPSAPWRQLPFTASNTQLLWVDVLEWACLWAAFTATPDQAATAVARAIYALGGLRIAYDCSAGAPTNYAYPEFDCTSFLERLAGGFGRGPRVNCTDCATAVATFANAVGADLWQSRMFNQIVPFLCNPIRVIGQFNFASVCGSGFFNYHEVAWEGSCTDLDQVYDACLQVLAPAPPAFSFMPYLPADVFFGWANGGSYRDLLVHPSSRLVCQAQPHTRKQRRVY